MYKPDDVGTSDSVEQEDSHFFKERKERRRYEIAKAVFIQMFRQYDSVEMSYTEMSNQAVTAADEFLMRYYQPETQLPVYRSGVE